MLFLKKQVDWQKINSCSWAVSAVIILANSLSILQLAIPSLLSTSPLLHDSFLFFEATPFASFISSSIFLRSACFALVIRHRERWNW